MKAKIILFLIEQAIKALKPEHFKLLADKVLDTVEDFVQGTDNEIDDALVLPLCAMIREAFGIED